MDNSVFLYKWNLDEKSMKKAWMEMYDRKCIFDESTLGLRELGNETYTFYHLYTFQFKKA